MFTRSGSSTANVRLKAKITDIAVADAGRTEGGDAAPGDVSNSAVTFMKGDEVLCGPVPVIPLDASDPTIGTAACGSPVTLPVGSHDIDVQVEGFYSLSRRVGQVEVDKNTLNYVAGGGFLAIWNSAGEYVGDAGSRASFGFRVRYNPTRTNVRGHLNLLFVSDGSTYQVRSRAIDSIVPGPAEGLARFVTYASFTDVTHPLGPVFLGANLRVVVR